jgi:hypothetical protein
MVERARHVADHQADHRAVTHLTRPWSHIGFPQVVGRNGPVCYKGRQRSPPFVP